MPLRHTAGYTLRSLVSRVFAAAEQVLKAYEDISLRVAYAYSSDASPVYL